VKRLPWVVGGVAGAVLLTEITLTRLFSVLLFYHFSFLAVALALFGLALGGVSAARRDPGANSEAMLPLIRRSLVRAAAGLLALVPVTILSEAFSNLLLVAIILAGLSAIPLFFLGEALATCLAIGRDRIHRFYAVDLVSSALAALASIALLGLVQGALVLSVPALIVLVLALVLTPIGQRKLPAVAVAAVGGVVLFASVQDGPLLPVAMRPGRLVSERWNAHSRVVVWDYPVRGRWLVIDRTAASNIPYTPAASQEPPAIDPSWAERYPDPAYALDRAIRRVAIIGLGGGPDILPALAAGASRIDGLELNGRVLDLLRASRDGYTTVARRPEVELVHDEARHALQHRRVRYDLIRANLIDTWAATAQGGFVLAENGIYTVQAWRLFLNRLTPTGLLATTRWYLPGAPAEAERLIALGAEALEQEGLRPASRHLIAVALPSPGASDPRAGAPVQTITAIVSRRAFTLQETAALERFVVRQGGTILLAPGRVPSTAAAAWPQLLSAGPRAAAIASSPWAIDPPTDERPFFFLQIRPRDVFSLGSEKFGMVSAITFNGVRVLLTTAALAVVAAALVTWQAGRRPVISDLRLSLAGRWYFAAIGLGYMAVQLALLQRLTLVIGHPTTCLALVVATMLLGTGLGSAVAGDARLRGASLYVLAVPAVVVALLALMFPHIGVLGEIPPMIWVGLLTTAAGMALGVALPTGIRTFTSNRTMVAEAWAINGAYSILGSAFAALGGLMIGSRGLLVAAVLCYSLAFVLLAVSQGSALAADEKVALETMIRRSGGRA
jgi:hypothetical protein